MIPGSENSKVTESALKLHNEALVWDNHICLPHVIESKWPEQLVRHKQSGTDVAIINLGDSNVPLDTIIRMAAFLRDWITAHPQEYKLIETVADIRIAKQGHKLGVAFNIEGAQALGDQPSLLQLLYGLGLRWMSMAYNVNNLVAGGCHDEDSGLTGFGYRFIEEMDRVGIVKCCSHTGYRSAMDVLTHTDVPTIFSHSNPRALTEHPRNIPDELIKASAATGGVICINGVSIFLGDDDIKPETVARHIDHVVQLTGIEHVGLGIDYCYDLEDMSATLDEARHIWPEGLGYEPGISIMAPEQLPEITDALLAMNYGEGDVRKVLGENLLRVAGQVWK